MDEDHTLDWASALMEETNAEDVRALLFEELDDVIRDNPIDPYESVIEDTSTIIASHAIQTLRKTSGMTKRKRDSLALVAQTRGSNLPGDVNTRVVLVEVEVDDYDGMCPVCICEFKIYDTATTLPCGHTMHEKCVSRWVHKTGTCPMCRDDVHVSLLNQQLDEVARHERNVIGIVEHDIKLVS